MDYSYYPGCSLHSTGVAYDDSMRATFAALGAGLIELDDWNCCGATAYMSVKETVACSVSARNLALVEQTGLDLIAPCSACWCVLNKTRKFMHELPELRQNVETALREAGLSCKFESAVRHPLEVIVNDFGVDQLVARQKRSLNGLRVACYYGCQIVRPALAIDDDAEVPMVLDDLLAGLGAQPVPYPPKARCCGGMLVATFEDVAAKLCDELASWARVENADCIVTTCPLCHANLELLQEKAKAGNGTERAPLPVLYFTQLIGVALGCSPEQVGLDHNFTALQHEFPRLTEAPSHVG